MSIICNVPSHGGRIGQHGEPIGRDRGRWVTGVNLSEVVLQMGHVTGKYEIHNNRGQ